MAAYYNEIEPYAAEWLRNLIKAGNIPHGEVDTRSIVDVSPDELRGYTQCHFFAGIGGWGHALRLAGWPDDRPIWTGSCPCQPFSVAGKGAGTDDPRHLWPHFHRLITAVRPPVVMGEQVAGQAGYGWLDGVRADLERENYASRGVDIPACSVDAPHIRQRLYWIASDMGDAHDAGLEGHAGHGDGRIRRAPEDGPTAQASGGHMADADQLVASQEREQRGGQQRGSGRDQGAGDDSNMADADYKSIRRGRPAEAHGTKTGDAREAQQWEWVRADTGSDGRGGSGFWSDHIWLTGADGKSRRSKPGLPLLAHGIPNRVGRLRAYGNAIVAQVAAEVIKAFLEAEEAA